jgi:O-antigen ligase
MKPTCSSDISPSSLGARTSVSPTQGAPARARGAGAARRILVRVAWLGLVAHAAFLSISIAGMQIGLAVAVLALAGLAACGQPVWSRSVVTAPVVVLCAGAITAIVVPWVAGLPPLHALDVVAWRAFAAPLAVVLALEAGREGDDPEAPRRRALAFLAIWAAAALVPAALAAVQVRTGFDLNHALGLRRVAIHVPAPDAPGRFAAVGFFSWYTRLSYAMLLVAAFAGAHAILAPGSRRLRLLFGGSAVAASAAVVLGGSRAAWVALSVAALVLASLAGRRVARIAVPLAIAGSIVAGAASPGLRARLLRLESPGEANGDRAMTWRVCRELVREHPLTGVGYFALGKRIDGYFERFAPGGKTRHMCHDVLYSAWAEGGPLFAAAVAAWWILLCRGFLRARRGADALGRAAAAGVLSGLAAMFVMSLVHDILWASEAVFGIGGLVGAGAVLARPRERPRGSAPDLSPLVK